MIQIVIILVILLAGGGFGAWTYMEKLQADNQVLQINQEVLKENELKLNDAIASNNRLSLWRSNDKLSKFKWLTMP